MKIELIIFGILLTLFFIWLSLRHKFERSKETMVTTGDCGSCTSTAGSCNSECLIRESLEKPIYFDDEELDLLRGKPANSYTDDEIEAFADVLYTTRPEEVEQWLRSLQLRGIELPESLKTEAAMLVNDNRSIKT